MKNKINKETIPEDFTLALAIVDAIPVIAFCVNMIVINKWINSNLFLIGAFLCLFAGICKVLWKIIVVTKKKNIWFLFIQMRITMPIGLILMSIGIIINQNTIHYGNFFNSLFSIPSIIFFSLGIIGMLLMLVFAFALDNSKLKNNWLEQVVNGLAQVAILISLLLIQ